MASILPQPRSAIIENLRPLLDGGRHPIKRAVGQDLTVEADVFKDGHDVVAAVLKWRPAGASQWHETPMVHLGNDRWQATCSLFASVTHEYTIEAWADVYRSWQHEFHKKVAAGMADVGSDLLEGAALVAAAADRAGEGPDGTRLRELADRLKESAPAAADAMARWPELEALMAHYSARVQATEFTLDFAVGGGGGRRRPVYPQVLVDRERALFAAWYEFFPRSAEGLPDRGSRLRDCLGRIDDARAMGFDVIYFPPIHPIGATKRKGRNNAVECEPGDPGVPYAIGNRFQGCPHGGGHKDIAPELGTFEDFAWLIDQLARRGMELALDFAINCSPDHPYVEEHPEWFYKRPDGTIKYAENPPKKYEDIYPLDFWCADWRALWAEMAEIILFWAERRVRIFRVDNPHTKPLAFWEYLIGRVRAKFPDVIFLAEAFTRPKMMKVLAKGGFNQSYTYFTWRNSKAELEEYFTELTQTEMVEYYRGNLFTNTPDILPFYLQHGGRPAFMVRAALAATLAPSYGIYSGFELCENEALPGREEYADSEKYHFKGRDWNRPGNIKEFITKLNRIRRENRALQEYANLRFYRTEADNVLCYGKATAGKDNLIVAVVNLDPYQAQGTFIHLPLRDFGFADGDTYQMHDLLTGQRYLWRGARNFVKLDPAVGPAHVFRVRRWASREQDFDYYQ